jgi:hypothetical protein
MTLPIPTYLEAASVQDNVLRYEWDDWRTLPSLEATDEELVARLRRVSYRAVLAFACGTAEWIVYRFGSLNEDSAPWNFLEAAWAMIVDVRYCGYGDATAWQAYSPKKWNGPVKGPIDEALKTLEIAFQQLASEYHTDPTVFAATISTLACHVMTDSLPYKTWSGQVLAQFESIYPRKPGDELGDVVPRQAVDPEFDFKVEQTETLMNHFLETLDYHSNMFLSSPEGMREKFEGEESFQGTPYVYSMEADRREHTKSRARRDDNY